MRLQLATVIEAVAIDFMLFWRPSDGEGGADPLDERSSACPLHRSTHPMILWKSSPLIIFRSARCATVPGKPKGAVSQLPKFPCPQKKQARSG